MNRFKEYLEEGGVRRDLAAKARSFGIKDAALALTGEVETLIENLLKGWYDAGELEGFDKSDIAKMTNLAIKNIKVKKVISGF